MNLKKSFFSLIDLSLILFFSLVFFWFSVIGKVEPGLDVPLVKLHQEGSQYKIEEMSYLGRNTYYLREFVNNEPKAAVLIEGACFDLDSHLGKLGQADGYFTNQQGYHAYYLTQFRE